MQEADHMNHVDQGPGLMNLMRRGEEEEEEDDDDDDDDDEEMVRTRPRAKRGSATDPQSLYARVYMYIFIHEHYAYAYIHTPIHR
jgi:hypothetical protein